MTVLFNIADEGCNQEGDDVNHEENNYITLLKSVIEHGTYKEDRTNTGTYSLFDTRLRFNLENGEFPLLTTKKVSAHAVLAELDWFLSGSTQVTDLVAMGCNIWNPWAPHQDKFGGVSANRPLVVADVKEDLVEIDDTFSSDTDHYKKYQDDIAEAIRFRDEYLEDESSLLSVHFNEMNALYVLWENLRTLSHNTWEAHVTLDDSQIRESNTSSKHKALCLHKDWLRFEQFFYDVRKLPNYVRVMGMLYYGKEIPAEWVLTSYYTKDLILSNDTAMWLHQDEIDHYEAAERNGIVKVTFTAENDIKRPPQYFFTERNMETSHRFNPGKFDYKIEHIGADEIKEGKRLRYNTSLSHLGPIYGSQWRSWENAAGDGTVDQINNVVRQLRNNPDSRRILVNAWNVSQLKDMALPPCHLMFQFYTEPMEDTFGKQYHDIPRKLHMKMYQRSADLPIGTPYNIASYAALLIKMAYLVNMTPGILIIDMGDSHIYANQVENVKMQIGRTPKKFPKYKVDASDALVSGDIRDVSISITGYDHHPAIKYPVAV